MTKPIHPHSRSQYPRSFDGTLTGTKLKRLLSKEIRSGEPLLQHNQVSVTPMCFITLAKELTNSDSAVSGQIHVIDSASGKKCTIHSDAKVGESEVVFWSKYEGDSDA